MKIPFQKYWLLLRKYLIPHKKRIIFLAVTLLSNIALLIINPLIIRYYIDSVSTTTGTKQLSQAAILFIGIAIVQQILHVISVFLSQDLAWNSTNSLRSDLVKHCMKLDLSFHSKKKPGEMIERVDGDVNELSNFFSQFTLLVLSNIILIIGILFSMFLINWIIGLVFAIYTIFAIILTSLVRNIAVPYWKKARQYTADLFGFIEEKISGRPDILANGGFLYMMKKFHDASKKEFDGSFKAFFVSQLVVITVHGIVALGSTLVFVTAIPAHRSGNITLGTVFLLFFYAQLLITPIIEILRQIQDLQTAEAGIDRVNELFTLTTIINDQGNTYLTADHLSLEFESLSFSYIENELVLRNISFKLESGKVMGLLGKTGSGKTTLTKLLFRLYDSSDGKILFNGIDIKEIPLKKLRNAIAIVTQDVELFQASLKDNITFFDKTIPDNIIIQTIKDVGLDDWYNKLPQGLDTIIKSNNGMSAGEAQLLALTRVFLKNPQLVILDEASSRLDPLTERLLETAISKLLKNRTGIIIAHKLTTLNTVDDILILEKGNIIEHDSRENLINDPKSRFSKLLKIGIEEGLT